MPEWLHEQGIGEERAILVEGGTIVAARVDWHEGLQPGRVAEARLIAKPAGGRRGTARFADNSEALVDGLPREACEGQLLRLRVTRAALAERGRHKLAQARPAPGEALSPAPSLLEQLRAGDLPVRSVAIGEGQFDRLGWHDMLEQAQTGVVEFAGGALTISPTPALTVIDVDGTLAPPALTLAAVPAIVAAMGRLDIGGSVGIDFPTLADKRDRQAVDAALASAMTHWRGERTAMNGFGFVQLVSRLERPSLVALFQQRPIAAVARMLLRQAERVPPPGALLLTAHPAVTAALRPAWLAELARRSGRTVHLAEDASLAPGAGFAQALAP